MKVCNWNAIGDCLSDIITCSMLLLMANQQCLNTGDKLYAFNHH